MKLRKNIWLAFYVIVLTWVTAFFLASHFFFKSAYDEFAAEQVSITTMFASSVKAKLRRYEVIIDMLSVNAESGLNIATQTELDRILAIDQTIVTIAVFDPKGAMVLATSNIPLPYEYHIQYSPKAIDTFNRTLHVDAMVVGRTYYNIFLDALIIPMRKSVRHPETGEVMYVISVAVNLENAFDVFIDNDKTQNAHFSYIYRDIDRYFQLAPDATFNEADIYEQQILASDITASAEAMVKYAGMPYSEIKDQQRLVTWKIRQANRKSLVTSLYLKHYGLWLASEIALSKIYSIILFNIAVLLVFFSITLFVIYRLFLLIQSREAQRRKALEYQAKHDYLTQLHNRFYLEKKFGHLALEDDFWLLFIDLDNFKLVNDSYGHDYGDKVLCEISHSLRELMKSGRDELIRYSGDEFIAIARDRDKAAIKALGQTILTRLNEPFSVNECQFKLSSSIGVAHYPNDGSTLDEVKRHADLAMYESKLRRNTLTFFKPYMRKAYVENATLEQELQHALSCDEFSLVYQPKLNLCGVMVGVEALLRWNNPRLGTVPPDKFIPLAESSGIMAAVGQFVLCKSLCDVGKLNQRLGIELGLSVNVSVTQFVQEDFFDQLSKAVALVTGCRVALTAEITESTFIEDLDATKKLLTKLKSKGVAIALDDFGTGYSSLNILRKLPIDELKIDKSFVDDILDDHSAYTMVEQIIKIGKNLGMSIVAEGVETQQQYLALGSLGCGEFQGFYFSKPLTLDELEQYCTEKHGSVQAV